MIADEDLAPREPHPRPRSLDHVHQPNDRRPRKEPIRGPDRDLGVFQNFCLAAVYQH
jgi:hypothetical protein